MFLDQDLNVRRYTDRVTNIVNIREGDVGRPLSDLTSSLRYPQLQGDALETLRTLAFSEKQVATTDDRWFSVRIMPYRRLDNKNRRSRDYSGRHYRDEEAGVGARPEFPSVSHRGRTQIVGLQRIQLCALPN